MAYKKKLAREYLTCASIKPTSTYIYEKRIDKNRFKNFNPPPKINNPDGKISQKASKIIKDRVNWMILFSEKKRVYSKKENKEFSFLINFITLTLSDTQMHSDKYIKAHLLKPFLKWIDRTYQCKFYLWKAEAQDNGNIHFHITTNQFIPWKSIRKKWNSIQKKHGYLTKYIENMKSTDANSTDVHAVKNEKTAANYLSKYFTKNKKYKKYFSLYSDLSDNHYYAKTPIEYEDTTYGSQQLVRKIEGRLWSCSEVFTGIKISTNTNEGDIWEHLKAADKNNSKMQLDYGTLYLHQNLKYTSQRGDLVNCYIAEIYEKIKDKLPQKKFFTVDSFY